MPPKIKPTKSVSFQHLSDEEVTKSPYILKSEFPQFKNSVLTIPFHSLFLIVGMYKFGLTTDIYGVLLKGFFSLIPLSLLYGYLITDQNRPASKTKGKNNSENIPLLLIGGIIICLVLSVPLFVSLILFGSPLASHLKETYLLSLHLSFLLFYPSLILYKYDYESFIKFLNIENIYSSIAKNQILFSGMLTVIGTWLGVIPIPLDWDRDWQQWPITLLTGGYLGSFLGGVLCFIC